MQELRLPSEIWNNYIFQKFLSYTDILNFMSINDTRLNKQFIEYAFDEYHSQYIDIMILDIRDLLLKHNKDNMTQPLWDGVKLLQSTNIFRLILDDKDILLNILRHQTKDITLLKRYNISISHTSNPYIHTIIEIERCGINFFCGINSINNNFELKCFDKHRQKFEGFYYGYRMSKWHKDRMNIKVFRIKNNYWYSIIKWDKDDIKSEEYIYN